MASLFQQKSSRFWWVKYRDPKTGKVVRKPTPFEHGDRRQTRQAEILRSEREIDELRAPAAGGAMVWSAWVTDYLRKRHAASPLTLTRKLTIWRTLDRYLDEKKLTTPAMVNREHCLAYLPWRKEQRSFKSKRDGVAHNTILLELRVFHSILQEAVRRGWCVGNPCSRLEIAKETPREKPELTDEQIEIIRAAIQERFSRSFEGEQGKEERKNAEFLRISFEIAIAQGCRMSETLISMEDVDLINLEITMLAKGRKRYTAPMNPCLVPLFQDLIAKGAKWTYERPRMSSLIWFKFLDRLRENHPSLRRVSFHSTRVTVASRMGRGGVQERVAMAILNHASTTVHRIYRRVQRSEVAGAWETLAPRSPSSETSGAPSTNSPPPPASSSSHAKT
jgi:site-specific recombinase XerD